MNKSIIRGNQPDFQHENYYFGKESGYTYIAQGPLGTGYYKDFIACSQKTERECYKYEESGGFGQGLYIRDALRQDNKDGSFKTYSVAWYLTYSRDRRAAEGTVKSFGAGLDSVRRWLKQAEAEVETTRDELQKAQHELQKAQQALQKAQQAHTHACEQLEEVKPELEKLEQDHIALLDLQIQSGSVVHVVPSDVLDVGDRVRFLEDYVHQPSEDCPKESVMKKGDCGVVIKKVAFTSDKTHRVIFSSDKTNRVGDYTCRCECDVAKFELLQKLHFEVADKVVALDDIREEDAVKGMMLQPYIYQGTVGAVLGIDGNAKIGWDRRDVFQWLDNRNFGKIKVERRKAYEFHVGMEVRSIEQLFLLRTDRAGRYIHFRIPKDTQGCVTDFDLFKGHVTVEWKEPANGWMPDSQIGACMCLPPSLERAREKLNFHFYDYGIRKFRKKSRTFTIAAEHWSQMSFEKD